MATRTQVASISALAEAFGVSRPTIYKWQRAAVGVGPPYDLVAWYHGAVARGFEPPLPSDPEVAALCARNGPPPAGESPAVTAALDEIPPEGREALDQLVGHIGRPKSWQEARHMIAAGLDAVKTQQAMIELETAQRRRLPIDEVRAWTERLRTAILTELAGAPAIVARLDGLTPAQVDAVRDALITWAGDVRRRIAGLEVA